MDPDFGERHHHLYYDHLRFAGLHETFQWLPLLAGILATVAVAWILLILLGGDRFQQSRSEARLPSNFDPVRQRWHCAVRSHTATAQQFADYECTPVAVAQRPDLADVTRPATALFIDAFAEVNALATEHYPGTKHAEQFIQAAQRAQRAWQTALDTACHSGFSLSTAGQRLPLNSRHEDGPRDSHQRTQSRIVALQRVTGWAPTGPGRHRAQARDPRHAADRPQHTGPARHRSTWDNSTVIAHPLPQ